MRKLIVLVAVLGIGSSAMAEQPHSAAEARQAAEEGRREYNLGHWRQAVDGFEKAYQLSGDPALLFNLAQTHRQLGNGVEALRLYHAYIREQPTGPSREVAEKQIEELRAQNWHDPFDQEPPSGALKPAAAPAPPPTSSAAVGVPIASPSPPVASQPVHITEVSTPSQPALPKWLPIAAAGTTLILAAAATVYGLSANSRFNSLTMTCGQTAAGCTQDQINDLRSRDHTATVLWVLTGVVAAGTGVAAFVNVREARVSALWRF